MPFLSHFLAAGLLLTGASWCQTVISAHIRIKTVPGSVQAVPAGPISAVSFRSQLSPSLAVSISGLVPAEIAPLTLPASEITAAVPSLGAAAPTVAKAGPSYAPEGRKAEGSLESRIQRLSETVAVLSKTAGEDYASPGEIRQAGRDMEKALTGETPVTAQEDLPPAGPAAGATLLASMRPDALAASILKGPPAERWETFIKIKKTGDVNLVRGVWAALSRAALSGPMDADDGSQALYKLPFAAHWYKDSRQVIERRMPTLAAILKDPVKLRIFLLSLSFLRVVYPFDLHEMELSRLPPIAWAKESGVEFKLGELTVVPVSESFRRHILYVDDPGGRYAIQLKMPGQDSHRYEINPEHFTAAKDLWDRFPGDPGVVRPLYLGRFAGTAKLYGFDLSFSLLKPLGIAIWEYQDGLRMYPKPPFDIGAFPSSNEYYEAKTRWYASDPVYLAAITDIAVTAIRIHRLGWRGSDTYDKRRFKFRTDMHAGNVIRGADGRARLVADFGAFRKTWLGLSMSKRRLETLTLLGHPPGEALIKISREVARRLSGDSEDPSELKRTADEVAAELGLSR